MKMKKSESSVTLTREPMERALKNDSDLFYKLRNLLRAEGEDVIKKEMSKDGHMVSDHVFYVRSRSPGRPGTYGIYDPHYQLRSVAEEFNKQGTVKLSVVDLSE